MEDVAVLGSRASLAMTKGILRKLVLFMISARKNRFLPRVIRTHSRKRLFHETYHGITYKGEARHLPNQLPRRSSTSLIVYLLQLEPDTHHRLLFRSRSVLDIGRGYQGVVGQELQPRVSTVVRLFFIVTVQ